MGAAVGCLVGALAATHTWAVLVTPPLPVRDEMAAAAACGIRQMLQAQHNFTQIGTFVIYDVSWVC